MNAFADFHFLRPGWLLCLLPLLLGLWALSRRRRREGSWIESVDAWLLPHVLLGQAAPERRHGLSLIGLGGLLALLALAGPSWQRQPTPVFRNAQALVLALALSSSMNAADIKPSRLERAKFKITDLLKARKDGQTALVAYAGDAFTVAPLTDDAATLQAQLGALDSRVMPVQGQRAAAAFKLAGDLLRQAGIARGEVLLLADGAEAASAIQAAAALRTEGHAVFVLGLGTEQGAPLAIPKGGFQKDATGAVTMAKLDSTTLKAIAEAGGGSYVAVTPDAGDVRSLTALFERQALSGQEQAGQGRLDLWQDEGPWLLLPLLVLAPFAFRRGLLFVFVLLVLPVSKPAQAFEWRDLWLTPDQRGREAMESQDYAAAAEHFQNPVWKSAAQYRAGQFEPAAAVLAGREDADALYNQGNALAQAGKYPEAIAAYERALKKKPDMKDARYNKELVEKQLKQQQEQQQQKKDQQQKSQGQSGQQQDKADSKGQDQGGQQDKQQDSPQQGDDSQDSAKRDQAKGKEGNEEKDEQDQAQERPGSDQEPEPEQATNHPQAEAQAPDSADAKDPQAEPKSAQAADAPKPPDETQQANEAWLKRIPDDPGGLLRRKFQYQYELRQQEAGSRQGWR